MKKIIITIILCLSISITNSQTPVSVNIVKTSLDSKVYVRTTIKNISNNDIWIPNISNTDDCGNAEQISPSYIKVFSYDLTGNVIDVSKKIYLIRTEKFPYKIMKLKPLEIYTMYTPLYNSNGDCQISIWGVSRKLNCKQIQIRLHLKYFLETNTPCEFEYISNLLAL